MGGDHSCYGCGVLDGGVHAPACKWSGVVTPRDWLYDPVAGCSVREASDRALRAAQEEPEPPPPRGTVSVVDDGSPEVQESVDRLRAAGWHVTVWPEEIIKEGEPGWPGQE